MARVLDPLDLLAATNDDGTARLTLVGNRTCEQPLLVEVVAQRGPRLITWKHLHAYLVATTNVDDLTTWAQGQDWHGRWMPDTAEPCCLERIRTGPDGSRLTELSSGGRPGESRHRANRSNARSGTEERHQA